jgi:starch synthase
MMMGAFETADCISTVSPQYAKEILDPWYAYGLDGILESKKDKLVGILNGINTADYDPAADKAIAAKYSLKKLDGKAKCKKALQKKMGLEEGDKPLIGIVTRLVAHKGIGLIRYVFEDIIKSGAQAVILGSGEQVYEEFFKEMHDRYRGDVAVHIGFDPALARQIYAGADIFLMPSENEPCGLAQMIALRYGTIPIVRETGGLKDTIRDFDGSEGNGYSFKNCNAHELLTTVLRALQNYKDREGWDKLIHNAMSCDYSWTASAKKYIELYKGLTSRLS